jgi:hypothetical protein
MSALSRFAFNTPPVEMVSWPSPRVMILKDLSIDIDRVFLCVKQTLEDLRVRVHEKVLFGMRTDFRLPKRDTQNERTHGYSIFGASDDVLNNVDSAAFIGALLQDGRLCHLGPDGAVVWNQREVYGWLSDIHKSWSDIYCLLHLLSLSGRGTEEALYQWGNSPEGRRHLFIVNEITAILSNYHKGHQITGLYKQILRLIPNELGYILAILLRIIRPIEVAVVGLYFTPDTGKAKLKKLYASRIFVTYGQPWSSEKMSLLLKSWWMRNVELPIGLNLHRQFSVALQRQFLSYRNNNPKRQAAQHAFAHGEQADEMNYARKHGDPSMPLGRQQLFEEVCRDWLKLFGFDDPSSYRPL